MIQIWIQKNNIFTLRKEGDRGMRNRGDEMELRRTFETKGRSFLKMETGMHGTHSEDIDNLHFNLCVMVYKSNS